MRRRWTCRHAMAGRGTTPAISGNTEHQAEQPSLSSAWGAGAKGPCVSWNTSKAFYRPTLMHAACWAHSRRRFVEATKLNQQDVASARIVAQMAKLFAIDAQARDENMDHAARHSLRMERAPLVLAELKAQIESASRTALPSSPLGKAAAYTLRLWDKLRRFLDYPELELSNNLAENSMRPVAIGRRNWTHIGHEKAGPD